jgi:hypothetical protein
MSQTEPEIPVEAHIKEALGREYAINTSARKLPCL